LDISFENINKQILVSVFLLLRGSLTILNIAFLLVLFLFIHEKDIYLFIIIVLLLNSSIYIYAVIKYSTLFSQVQQLVVKIVEDKIACEEDIKLDKSVAPLEGQLKNFFVNKMNVIQNLKRVEQIRTEFLGNVSHELRTPIFAMQGFLETLLNGALEDKNVNRVFVEKAYKHSQNLNNLLNDLIDISMIESGKMRMSFRYFGLKEFLLSIYQENLKLVNQKNLELHLKEPLLDVTVYGDQNRLHQVMNNLLQNAIKYTDKGKVEVEVINSGNKVEIIVSDSGIGIPEEDINRIFERFYRVDKNRSRAAGGTGLGLAIVKHIIEAHGDKIKVESQAGIGSKFSFCLRK